MNFLKASPYNISLTFVFKRAINDSDFHMEWRELLMMFTMYLST